MNFDDAVARLKLVEKGFTKDPRDRGNWTGGQIGKGVLKGTKFGISAAAYPHLDIEHLTWPEARQIYAVDYWGRVRCDELPGQLRYPMFDISVHSGQDRAIRFLQEAAGAEIDGNFGPKTLHAVKGLVPEMVLRRMDGQRLLLMADDPAWPTYGRGWCIRLAEIMLLIA